MVAASELGSEVRDLIRCHQDHDCGGAVERSIQHLSDVWRAVSGEGDGLGPFDRSQVDTSQEVEHRPADRFIPTMDDEYRSSTLFRADTA